ncbi:MAG: hypothetical protein H6729_09120 [Deltaproteobacteria bacterium]|nr:hypothetical protein [Deltaproteobacteria bacterium]
MLDALSPRALSLWLAMLAIAIGPLVFSIARRASRGLSFMDGLLLGSVGSLLLFHVIPDALEHGRWLAGLALLLGPALPLILEKAEWAGQERSARFAALIGAFVVLVHGVMDGAALGDAPPNARALSWAIVLHRVVDGALLWWLLRRRIGRAVTLLVLGLLGAATLLGFFITLDTHAHGSPAVAAFEAFVAGTLLFLLASHRSSAASDTADALTKVAALVGIALGLGLTFMIPVDHSVSAFMHRLVQTSQTTAPAILAGYVGLVVVGRLTAGRPHIRSMLRDAHIEALPLAIVTLGPFVGLLWFASQGATPFLARRAEKNLSKDRATYATGKTGETRATGTTRATGATRAPERSEIAVIDESIGRAWIGIYAATLLLQPLFDLSDWPPVVALLLAALTGGCFRISALGALPIASALIAAGAPLGAGVAFALAAGEASMPAPANAAEGTHPHGLHLRRSAWLQRIGIAAVAGLVAHGLTGGTRMEWALAAVWHPSAIALLALLVVSLVRRGPFALIDGLVSKGAHGSHAQHS